jgi:hypothetical protein
MRVLDTHVLIWAHMSPHSEKVERRIVVAGKRQRAVHLGRRTFPSGRRRAFLGLDPLGGGGWPRLTLVHDDFGHPVKRSD